MDVCGPLPGAVGGRQALTLLPFLDDYSKVAVVRLLAAKSDVAAAVRDVLQLLETQSGERALAVRTDNGGEYVSSELSEYFASRGIVHQKTAPYTPEQNGAAERLNRTLMDKVRPMLADAGLPQRLGAERL